ncbi:hypothetical protein V6N11_053270 [Hibiscus sabdariffa]|uniref:Uncharacterized protein n=1 Tax=Hibiscus sabdariffa TaxID=183260 RepID=A0ABR2UCK8_9ROSI
MLRLVFSFFVRGGGGTKGSSNRKPIYLSYGSFFSWFLYPFPGCRFQFGPIRKPIISLALADPQTVRVRRLARFQKAWLAGVNQFSNEDLKLIFSKDE